MTKARDISKLLSTANGKIAGENLDVSFENITDTGSEGTKVASGRSAQRGSTTGQIRFNSTTNTAEYYNGSEFKAIDTPPLILSVDVTNVETDLGGNQTFVVSGSNFNSGSTLQFRDNNGTLISTDTLTFNNSSQLTVTKTRSSFSNANEPYDIIVTNPSNLTATLNDAFNVDNPPLWNTASGNLGTINDDATGTHFTLSATDPDGDTISYSETTSILSTAGLTLNSSTGVISGNPTDTVVGTDVTYTFTVRATGASKSSDREFSLTVRKPPEYIQATGGTITYDGDYKIHTFDYNTETPTSDATATFSISEVGTNATYGDKIWYLLVGGGGSQAKGKNTTGFGLTAYGGGAGSQNGGANGDGGSGGGGRGDASVQAGSGVAGQGNNGGVGFDPHPEGAGGGGGAGQAGNAGRSQGNANGGNGLQNSITGTDIYYAGGGGGGNYYQGGASSGGLGGGGSGGLGGSAGSQVGGSGTNGLGGGAGGAGGFSGGGGAGGMLSNDAYDFTVTAQDYTIVTGGGATGTPSGGAGIAIVRYKYQ